MDSLTKKDLIELFDQQYDRFASEVQELRQSVEDRNDDVFQKMDQVCRQLKTMREKQVLIHYKIKKNLIQLISPQTV